MNRTKRGALPRGSRASSTLHTQVYTHMCIHTSIPKSLHTQKKGGSEE